MEKSQVLSLFSAIQQKSTLGISPEDEAFCQEQQAAYDAARSYFDALKAFIAERNPKNEYSKEEYSNNIDIPVYISTAKKQFFGKIYQYFREKYTVALNDDATQKRYGYKYDYYYGRRHDKSNDVPMRYEDIVKDILAQTGGLSFEETAVRQMKAEFADDCRPWARTGDRVSQSGATLSVDSFASPGASWNGGLEYSYTAAPKIRRLYQVLSHFELGRIEGENWRFLHLPCATVQASSKVELSPYEVNGEKVKAVRFFKNGKLSIKFSSSVTAAEFKRLYCRSTTP